MQFAHYSYQLSEVEDATVESRLTQKKKKHKVVVVLVVVVVVGEHLQAFHPSRKTT